MALPMAQPKSSIMTITTFFTILLLITFVKCNEEYTRLMERHQSTFIDKTQVLVSFFNQTREPFNFITCPRHFGKTSMLNMIETFAQIEIDDSGKPKHWRETRAYGIFSKLYIASYPEILSKHLAQWPVILIDLYFETIEFKVDKRYTLRVMTQLKHPFKDFKWLAEKTPQDFPTGSNITTDDILYLQRGNSGNLTKEEIQNSMLHLSRILFHYFNHKVILLVDGYDTAAMLAMTTAKRNVLKHYEFIHDMLFQALDGGIEYIEYALVTATSSVSFYSVDHSKMLRFKHRAFLDDHEFTSFCGFLEDELTSTFNKHECTPQQRLDAKKHYNGYTTSGGICIYDPYALTHFLESKDKQLKSYWPIDMRSELIYDFLHFNDLYETISMTLGDGSFESDFSISKQYSNEALYVFMQLKNANYTRVYGDKGKCVKQMLAFVFEQGYLAHVPGTTYAFRNPNQQTRLEMLNLFKKFVQNEGSPLNHIS